jgi:kynurenine 3-monooxygenase
MEKSNSEGVKKVCIVGAGLVGAMLSTYLAQRGFEVDLYEKRPDIRKSYKGGNRTITMSLSNRGFKALEGIGLAEKIRQTSIPKYGRTVHLPDGKTNYQQYGYEGDSINTVNRSQINSILLNRAEITGRVNMFFETRCMDIRHDEGLMFFKDLNTGESYSKSYEWIIGADGLNSAVRSTLEKNVGFESKLTTLNYAYKELKIPPDTNGDHRLEKNSVHIWPNEDILLVGLPSHEGVFTCNLFIRYKGKSSLEETRTRKDLEDLFQRFFPSVIPLMPGLFNDYFDKPESRIETVSCKDWNYGNKVLLIGDAAHAIVPFFAMGMNAGFEDCTIFDSLMEEYNNDLSRVIGMYSKIRKPDIDAISELSLKNFMEISSSSRKGYDIKWKLDRMIWSLFPDHWMPLYPMIAFNHLPLSQAISRAAKQEEILDMILPSVDQQKARDEDHLEDVLKLYGETHIKVLEPIR